jgi:hypothetical protein
LDGCRPIPVSAARSGLLREEKWGIHESAHPVGDKNLDRAPMYPHALRIGIVWREIPRFAMSSDCSVVRPAKNSPRVSVINIDPYF